LDLGACPRCQHGRITENSRAFGCSRYQEGCGFTVWKQIAGHQVTEAELKALCEEGHSALIEDFRSKAGKSFRARLRLDDAGRVALDFAVAAQTTDLATDAQPPSATAPAHPPPSAAPRARIAACPKCHQGQIIRGRRGHGCERYREGCDFVILPDQFGAQLNDDQVRLLIEQGRTEPIANLLLPNGQRGHGCLQLTADHQLASMAWPDET
jgi:DNA topoisomerase-3